MNMPEQVAQPPEPSAFDAPWQAQAFALTVALHARGLFTWPQWAQVFGAQIAAAPARPGEDANAAYWRQWLAALESLLAREGAAREDELQRYRSAWACAARRTAHGQPLELAAADFPR